jgi:hypothetical protein
MNGRAALVFIFIYIFMGVSINTSCTPQGAPQNKVNTALSFQIQLREKQISHPTPENLEQMKAMGMETDNLSLQRIYIRLYKPLTASQADELKVIGITLYTDSWIPPAGISPTGSILADMPVDKLDILAAKDYIIGLDTAERSTQPLSDK